MDKQLYDEVLFLLDELSQDTTVPRNVRRNATESKNRIMTSKESLDIKCASAVSVLEDMANDPNVPSHGRAALYTIISKLESLAKSQ